MKKLLLSIWLTASLFYMLSAQAPQQFNYQAIVRNTSGTPVANNTAVTLRFTIHDNNASGTTVFTETQNTSANQFGLVNVQIGSINNLTPVNWGSGAKFLQVEVALNNSGTFTDMGTTQILSVPYALYAGKSTSHTQYLRTSIPTNYVRDTAVFTIDSMVVQESGTYLLSFYAQGHDNDIQSVSSTALDWYVTANVYNVTTASDINDPLPFVFPLPDLQSTTGWDGLITNQRVTASSTTVVNLTAGSVLKGKGFVFGFGIRTGEWGVGTFYFCITRVGD